MDPIPIILDQARLTIDRLRECWSWLEILVEPGRETRGPGQVETDAVRELQFYRAMHERAYKEWNLRHGRGALASTSAGARVSVLDARAAVHGQVVAVAKRIALSVDAVYLGPASSVDPVLAALNWIGAALDGVRDADLAAVVDTDLQRAARLAYDACRVDGDLERGAAGVVRELYAPIDGRCPACRNRSLQLVYDGSSLSNSVSDMVRRSKWHVRCVSDRCCCRGQDCSCGQRVRYAGRRHAWAFGELTGPYGLWRAMEAASPARSRLESRTMGHGGWSDRRTG